MRNADTNFYAFVCQDIFSQFFGASSGGTEGYFTEAEVQEGGAILVFTATSAGKTVHL